MKEGINRRELVQHLEAHQIETRLVFGGNILKQPGFMNIERRVHGTLEESDIIMNRTLFTGVFPGLTDEMIDYVIEQFTVFFKKDPVNSSVTLLS